MTDTTKPERRKECCHVTVLQRCADCPYERATTGRAQPPSAPSTANEGEAVREAFEQGKAIGRSEALDLMAQTFAQSEDASTRLLGGLLSTAMASVMSAALTKGTEHV